MPSNQSPLGALPARFRRQRLLIVGCGDVGLRVVKQLSSQIRVLALTHTPQKVAELGTFGVRALLGDLDQAQSLRRLSGLAHRVLVLAPPPAHPADFGYDDVTGGGDPRAKNLQRTLRLRSLPAQTVYASTSGVYGDCAGDFVSESRPLNAQTPRALRRIAAEKEMMQLHASVLRIPGIYAPDREGGTPRERLLKKTPVLQSQDDVYTNHIHADDLAQACIAALWRGKARRSYNISDDSAMKMGDYFDLAADLYGLPRPARVSRFAAQGSLPLVLLSFMGESRRLQNERMKNELRVVLKYGHVRDGLI